MNLPPTPQVARPGKYGHDPRRGISGGLRRRQAGNEDPPLVLERGDPALQCARFVEFERRHRQIVLRAQAGQLAVDFSESGALC